MHLLLFIWRVLLNSINACTWWWFLNFSFAWSQVALPPGESCAGWVAVHAIDFYNNASTIWAVLANDPFLSSFGPGEGYPSGVEYRWSEANGAAVSVPAPVYIEKALHWIADQINDETKFPDDDDEEEALRVFQTPAFAALCGQIFRRLFRVYGIIYSSFFGTLEALGMAPHLNTCFKHVSCHYFSSL